MKRNRLIALVAAFSTTLVCLCVIISIALFNIVPDYLDSRNTSEERAERNSDDDDSEGRSGDATLEPVAVEPVVVEPAIEEPAIPEITVEPEIIIEEPEEVVEEELFLGSFNNPIYWAIYTFDDPGDFLASADEIARIIEDSTGLVVEPFIIADFDLFDEVMCSGEAHMAMLYEIDYMLTHELGCANAWAIGAYDGANYYQGQIIVHADTGIEDVADLVGKTFCRSSSFSTSGWIIPSLQLMIAGIDLETDLDIIDISGGSIGVIEAIYNEECDAGATFLDAREFVDIEDVYDVVLVVEETIPIPNESLSFVPELEDWMAEAITLAIIDIASSSDTEILIEEVLFWTEWELIDDSFYDSIRSLFEEAGVEIWDITQ